MRALWWRLREWFGFGCQHDWFPGHDSREYIVVIDVCMDCNATRVILPHGYCLTGHPIDEHYDAGGRLVHLAYCDAPR